MNSFFKTSTGNLRWGWRAVILILGTILFGVILNSVLMTVLTVGYSSQGLAQEQAMERATITISSFGSQVVLSVLQLGFMLGLVRWLIIRVERRPLVWSELGLTRDVNRSRQLSLGALFAMALSLSIIGIGLVVRSLEYLGNGFEFFTPVQVIATLLLTTLLALASGFGEEIVFRGYLQSSIAKRYNSTTAVILAALLFALSHPIAEVTNPLLYLVTAILVGILFGVAFVRTGSLWMGIALHTLWNYLPIAAVAIRHGADERFFGAPLFVFHTISGTPHMLVEMAVIFFGLGVMVWLTKPVLKRNTHLYDVE